jgi:hypothetical protein
MNTEISLRSYDAELAKIKQTYTNLLAAEINKQRKESSSISPEILVKITDKICKELETKVEKHWEKNCHKSPLLIEKKEQFLRDSLKQLRQFGNLNSH